ncbi:hypothetical protein GE061_017098 [Apolygus lucorum]|uniref:Protein kinase domain-containing protein n=1 Tax=Apolygus lucorum TaxID=248454 RepID=A0A8S9XHT5_APOLU|nr:hypothetical protein GE061_017098 [Apolygus lucorum]
MEVVDDDVNFIRRPVLPSIMLSTDDSNDSQEGHGSPRPETPPNDQGLKLNKSLGLMMSPQSPPYRKIRSMRIIESPRPFIKSRLDLPFTSTPTQSPCAQRMTPRARTAPLRMQRSRLGFSGQSKEAFPLSQTISSPMDVINPFSPQVRSMNESRSSKRSAKRASPKRILFDKSANDQENDSQNNSSMDSLSSETSDEVECKRMRPRLSDFNAPRYKQEFLELEVIGVGVYGCVYKCMNIVNGVLYAIKKGLKPTANERLSHNEIYAHAVLEHPNIVRNYSNWTEDGHVFMQNEYCNGGSLEDEIKKGPMDEKHLRRVLEHTCQGLRFIHSKNLAHMDIKPGNIFIHRGSRLFFKNSYDQDEFSEDDETDTETHYKIGDLGHVTRLDEANYVREGDCRYFPKEILRDDYSNLTKVDIFSLGLTLFEAAGGGPLPKNGDEWHALRDGKIKPFPHLSHEINALIKRMVHPNPDQRPSAEDILTQISSSPIYKSVKEKHELKASKQQIQVLEQRLEDAMKCVKHLTNGKRVLNNNNKTLNNNKGERLVESVSYGLVVKRKGGLRKLKN